MLSSTKVTLLISALASTALAYQQVAMPVCTTAPGTPCNYEYTGTASDGSSVDVTVNAFCGPIRSDGNSYCADNGAKCKEDDECLQWCGMTRTDADGYGTCGGVGAQCYDQQPNEPNSNFFVCNGPSTVCSTNCDLADVNDCTPGTCLLAASPAAGLRRVKRVHRDFVKEARALALRRAARSVAMPGDEVLS